MKMTTNHFVLLLICTCLLASGVTSTKPSKKQDTLSEQTASSPTSTTSAGETTSSKEDADVATAIAASLVDYKKSENAIGGAITEEGVLKSLTGVGADPKRAQELKALYPAALKAAKQFSQDGIEFVIEPTSGDNPKLVISAEVYVPKFNSEAPKFDKPVIKDNKWIVELDDKDGKDKTDENNPAFQATASKTESKDQTKETDKDKSKANNGKDKGKSKGTDKGKENENKNKEKENESKNKGKENENKNKEKEQSKTSGSDKSAVAIAADIAQFLAKELGNKDSFQIILQGETTNEHWMSRFTDKGGLAADTHALKGGFTIAGDNSGGYGTLGGWLWDSKRKTDGSEGANTYRLFGLTNCHVLDDPANHPDVGTVAHNANAVNRDVYQQGRVVGKTIANVWRNDMDAALFAPNITVVVNATCSIQTIGDIVGKLDTTKIIAGLKVQKFGARTHHTKGFVRSVNGAKLEIYSYTWPTFSTTGITNIDVAGKQVPVPSNDGGFFASTIKGMRAFIRRAEPTLTAKQVDGVIVKFFKADAVGMFSMPGDSGSLYLDDSRNVTALHFAGGWRVVYGTPAVYTDTAGQTWKRLVKSGLGYNIHNVLTDINKEIKNNNKIRFKDNKKPVLDVCTETDRVLKHGVLKRAALSGGTFPPATWKESLIH